MGQSVSFVNTGAMFSIATFDDFHEASSAVLNFLYERLGFDLWMITRVEGENWIVLCSSDHGYEVESGDVFHWADSFCSQMVCDRGPRIAPCSQDIPVYAEAPIGKQIPIGAYIGVPLPRADGQLFGTLCAIDPQPKPEHIIDELPLIELLARMLTTVLESELKIQEQARRAERAMAESMTDSLTQLYNRRGWDQLMELEERRSARYGHPSCVVSIDLDDLKQANDLFGHAYGDQLLTRAADLFTSVVRDSDIAARVGGDEFAILAVECDEVGCRKLVARLEEILARDQISASIGYAMRCHQKTLIQTWELADQKMYANKRNRKAIKTKIQTESMQ